MPRIYYVVRDIDTPRHGFLNQSLKAAIAQHAPIREEFNVHQEYETYSVALNSKGAVVPLGSTRIIYAMVEDKEGHSHLLYGLQPGTQNVYVNVKTGFALSECLVNVDEVRAREVVGSRMQAGARMGDAAGGHGAIAGLKLGAVMQKTYGLNDGNYRETYKLVEELDKEINKRICVHRERKIQKRAGLMIFLNAVAKASPREDASPEQIKDALNEVVKIYPDFLEGRHSRVAALFEHLAPGSTQEVVCKPAAPKG